MEEEASRGGAMVQTQTGRQRKGLGVRVWLLVSEFGPSRLKEVGKHYIMRRTGLPARDLRVLDPMLSYPSSILGRERAIVINLEHIKAIITAKEVLMVNSTNPLVVRFAQDLQHRISCSTATEQQAMGSDMEDTAEATRVSFSLPSQHGSVKYSSERTSPSFDDALDMQNFEIKGKNTKSTMNVPGAAGPKSLPFEFRALEACLESACRCLESETQTLEEEAYPALDELTSKISTLNLERVRQIKSRLVAISGRVQKVRDELEHLLDDDNDMAEMYLTEKLASRSLEQSLLREEMYNAALEVDDERVEESDTPSETFTNFKPNIEELEMLLEAYFVQLDGILQKLSDMSEYVDDTEDCINIMLDDKQNQLLQMGVMLSTANMIINAGIVVVGLFGMNIHIPLFDGQPVQFWETTLGTIGGCVVLYIIAVGWGKKNNLLAL